MKKKKRHHYIPRLYLGGFTNDNGELFVLNKEKSIVEKQGRNGTFHKKYFYTVDFSKYKKRGLEETERIKKLFGLESVDTSEVREYPDMIEDLLGESESISIFIINKLISDVKITSLEKVEFSSFIALMYTRNPLFHEFIENREIEEMEQTINKIFISKESLKEACDKNNFACIIPPFEFCTDNAAMIGSAGYFRLQKGFISDYSLAMESTAKL